jgi:AbrB family looped-hinge helix DNA binding protein
MAAEPKQTTVLSTKGQVVLPRAIRDRRNWKAGARLTVEDTPEGVLLKPAPLFEPSTLEDVFGALKSPFNRPLSIEEMDAAVMAEARRRARD